MNWLEVDVVVVALVALCALGSVCWFKWWRMRRVDDGFDGPLMGALEI